MRVIRSVRAIHRAGVFAPAPNSPSEYASEVQASATAASGSVKSEPSRVTLTGRRSAGIGLHTHLHRDLFDLVLDLRQPLDPLLTLDQKNRRRQQPPQADRPTQARYRGPPGLVRQAGEPLVRDSFKPL